MHRQGALAARNREYLQRLTCNPTKLPVRLVKECRKWHVFGTTMNQNPEAPSFLVSRQGAAEQVMGDLRNRICQGIYPRGTKLPSERELATHYRVSGPTIREALRGLAATNLVRMRKGMGVYVIAATDAMFASALGGILELEKAQLLDILAVSEALYVKAVTLACEHATDEELRVIAETLELLDQRKAAEKLFEDLKTFLDLIARASHNVPLSIFCRFLMVLQVEVANEQIGGIPRNWETIATKLRSDRRELVSALQARDPALAASWAAAYHEHTRRLVSDVLATTGGESVSTLRRAIRRLESTV
jgi:GntR family transcriptional regulator, transcriptional repressor for pyruvate dehydrogenase complex